MTTKKSKNRSETYREDGVYERNTETPKPRSKRMSRLPKQLRLYDEQLEAMDDDAFLDSVMEAQYASKSSGKRRDVGFGWDDIPLPPPRFPRRDSITDPYEISFLSAEATGTPYKLGMGMHPGRQDFGTVADWSRSLPLDFQRIWDAGVRTIVCMVEAHEFSTLQVPGYIQHAEDFGFDVIWFPVRDVSTPESFRLMHKTLCEVWERLHAGNVLVHCRGGKGRTGTLACCMLELLGWPYGIALKMVRSTRKGTVETKFQEEWCRLFEGYVHAIKRQAGRDRMGADS